MQATGSTVGNQRVFFYPGVPGSMVVTWTTYNRTESRVEYGQWGGKPFDMSAKGSASVFVDSGSEKRKMYIHRVTLGDLKPGSRYGECWGEHNDTGLQINVLQHVGLALCFGACRGFTLKALCSGGLFGVCVCVCVFGREHQLDFQVY